MSKLIERKMNDRKTKERKIKDDINKSHPQIGYLNNISSVSEHYSKHYNKHIYIFGEYHGRKSKCINKKGETTVQFIIDNINYNKNKLIDFYLELPYIDKSKLKIERKDLSPGNLKDFFKHYKNCFEVVKTNCKQKNVRFHYTDIRTTYGYNKMPFLNYVFEYLEELEYMISVSARRDDYNIENKEYKSDIKEYEKLKTKKDFITYGLKSYSKILKNERNIKDPNVKLKLLQYLDQSLSNVDIDLLTWDYITNIIEYLKIIIKNEEENESENESESFNNFIEKVFSPMVHNFRLYVSYLMDIYLIARILGNI